MTRSRALTMLFATAVLALAVATTPALAAKGGKVGKGGLPAPTILTCTSDGTTITVDWTDVTGATKYDVVVTAGVDTDADGIVDSEDDFDFNTADRTDGLPPTESSLSIPESDLVSDTGLAPTKVDVRVKAMNPGHGHGRQHNPFSAPCSVR